IGWEALADNDDGINNTATGTEALLNNTADENTADGFEALMNNVDGINNVATGAYALLNNNGSDNTADGYKALLLNTTGLDNTASHNIEIGTLGVVAESSTIRIGTQGGGRTAGQTATYIAGVNAAAVMGVAVKVSAAGQLGTAPSSARFKEEIQPMDKASEAI